MQTFDVPVEDFEVLLNGIQRIQRIQLFQLFVPTNHPGFVVLQL